MVYLEAVDSSSYTVEFDDDGGVSVESVRSGETVEFIGGVLSDRFGHVCVCLISYGRVGD